MMAAEAEQMSEATGNSRFGDRDRRLKTCVDLNLRVPKLGSGSFFPEDVIERCQRVNQAYVSAVTETYATGTSVHKIQWIAEKMEVSRLSRGPGRRPVRVARRRRG